MKNLRKISSIVLALLLMFTTAAASVRASGSTARENANVSGHTYQYYQVFSGTQSDTDEDANLGEIQWGSLLNANRVQTLMTNLSNDPTFDRVISHDAGTPNDPSDDYNVTISYFQSLAGKTGTGLTRDDATLETNAAEVARILYQYFNTDDSDEAKAFARAVHNVLSGVPGTAYTSGMVLPAGYYLFVDKTTPVSSATDPVQNLSLLQLTKKGPIEIKSKVSIPVVQKKVKDKNDSTGVESSWQDGADYDVGDLVPFQLTATLGDISNFENYQIKFEDTLKDGLIYPQEISVYYLKSGETEANKHVIASGTTGGTYSVSNISSGTKSFTVTINNVKKLTPEVDNGTRVIVEYKALLNDSTAMKYGNPGNENEVYLKYTNSPHVISEGDLIHYESETTKDVVKVFTYKIVVNKTDGQGSPLTGAMFTLRKLVNGVAQDPISLDMANTADPVFVWSGIDDGQYVLEETVIPPGYNRAGSCSFTVSRDLVADDGGNPAAILVSNLTGSENPDNIYVTIDNTNTSDEVVNMSVQNIKGAVLPETGGIGTTVFYVFGGVMLACGVVLLITKKRVGEMD